MCPDFCTSCDFKSYKNTVNRTAKRFLTGLFPWKILPTTLKTFGRKTNFDQKKNNSAIFGCPSQEPICSWHLGTWTKICAYLRVPRVSIQRDLYPYVGGFRMKLLQVFRGKLASVAYFSSVEKWNENTIIVYWRCYLLF